MHFSKTLILLFFCVLSICACAQKPKVHNGGKSMYTRERFNYNATRIRGAKAKIVCPIFENSKFPYHGIGFKFGDPFAVTYKFYPTKRLAFAADFGKASSGLYNRYFREKFEEYTQTDDTVTYLTHKVNSDYIGELKVLYQFDAKRVSPGLQVYVGAGWEWKRATIDYTFTRDNSTPGTGVKNEIGHFDRQRFTQGPQAVLGIEYSYFQLPISAFMEVEYFYDIQADPGWTKFEGGVGLRYVF